VLAVVVPIWRETRLRRLRCFLQIKVDMVVEVMVVLLVVMGEEATTVLDEG
jgi:hypothetical protein